MMAMRKRQKFQPKMDLHVIPSDLLSVMMTFLGKRSLGNLQEGDRRFRAIVFPVLVSRLSVSWSDIVTWPSTSPMLEFVRTMYVTVPTPLGQEITARLPNLQELRFNVSHCPRESLSDMCIEELLTCLPDGVTTLCFGNGFCSRTGHKFNQLIITL